MILDRIQYFDFSFHFALFNGFQNFDDDVLVAGHIDAGVDFRVLALAYFVDDLVVFNIAESYEGIRIFDLVVLVVVIGLVHLLVDIGIEFGLHLQLHRLI